MKAFAICQVIGIKPKVRKEALVYIPNNVLLRESRFVVQVAHVGVHQRPARTDIPCPRDGHGAIFHEVADIICASPVIAGVADIQAAIKNLEERIFGGFGKCGACK